VKPVDEVAAAAEKLKDRDEASLEILIGLRAKEIERDERLKDDPEFIPRYNKSQMGLMDDVQALGKRIAIRWSKELHGLVCNREASGTKDREAILNALNLGENALIGAVAGALMALGLFPALAAAVAPLVVKRFILPARDELCVAWGEALHAQN